MNREIKLRAWSPDNNEMYYPDEIYSFRVYNTSIGFYPHYDSDELTYYNTHPSSEELIIYVMQWTGLKDKNGKDIYEGDLIVHTSRNGGLPHPVVYRDGAFCGNYGLIYPLIHEHFDKYCEITVVGNIHQNPELIPQNITS